jgi:hypothetical protein
VPIIKSAGVLHFGSELKGDERHKYGAISYAHRPFRFRTA